MTYRKNLLFVHTLLAVGVLVGFSGCAKREPTREIDQRPVSTMPKQSKVVKFESVTIPNNVPGTVMYRMDIEHDVACGSGLYCSELKTLYYVYDKDMRLVNVIPAL